MSIVRLAHGFRFTIKTLAGRGSAFTGSLPAAPDEVSGAPIDGVKRLLVSRSCVDILKGRSILVLRTTRRLR